MPKYWVTCINKFLVEANTEDEVCDFYADEYDYVEAELAEEEEN